MNVKASIWHSIVDAFTECLFDLLTCINDAVQINECPRSADNLMYATLWISRGLDQGRVVRKPVNVNPGLNVN